jgi:hypothetical protein
MSIFNLGTLTRTAVLILLLLWAGLIFTTPLAPLHDYPNHLARMHLLAFGADDPILMQFYKIHWSFQPNLVMDLLVPPLARHTDLYVAGQIFLTLTLILLTFGVFSVQRALFKQSDALPILAVFVFGICMPLTIGFLNYLFGFGLALCFFAGWVLGRAFSSWIKGLFFLSATLVLYISHLITVPLFWLLVILYEISTPPPTMAQFYERNRRQILYGLIFCSLVFSGLCVVSYIAAPTIPESWGVEYNLFEKIALLYTLFFTYDFKISLLIFSVCALAAYFGRNSGNLIFHPVGGLYAAGIGLIYVVLPGMIMGSGNADNRLLSSAPLVFVCTARFAPHLRSKTKLIWILGICALAALRFFETQSLWSRMTPAIEDLRQSFTKIEKGSHVLISSGVQRNREEISVFNDMPQSYLLEHVPVLLTAERSAFVPILFAKKGNQPVEVLDAFKAQHSTGSRPPVLQEILNFKYDTASAPAYFRNWPSDFQYLYMIGADGVVNPRPDILHEIAHGPFFRLYKITPPTPLKPTTAEGLPSPVPAVPTGPDDRNLE